MSVKIKINIQKELTHKQIKKKQFSRQTQKINTPKDYFLDDKVSHELSGKHINTHKLREINRERDREKEIKTQKYTVGRNDKKKNKQIKSTTGPGRLKIDTACLHD